MPDSTADGSVARIAALEWHGFTSMGDSFGLHGQVLVIRAARPGNRSRSANRPASDRWPSVGSAHARSVQQQRVRECPRENRKIWIATPFRIRHGDEEETRRSASHFRNRKGISIRKARVDFRRRGKRDAHGIRRATMVRSSYSATGSASWLVRRTCQRTSPYSSLRGVFPIAVSRTLIASPGETGFRNRRPSRP